MLAFTTWQPRATAIAEGWKDVENRTWAPPQRVIGERIAIHAGLTFDEEGAVRVASLVAGVTPLWLAAQPRGAVIATALFEQVLNWSASPWWEGPLGWHMTDVRRLSEPVPCRGMQGIWCMPRDVERLVLEREVVRV